MAMVKNYIAQWHYVGYTNRDFDKLTFLSYSWYKAAYMFGNVVTEFNVCLCVHIPNNVYSTVISCNYHE